MNKNINKTQDQCTIHSVSTSDVYSFLEWLSNQKKDYMGGEFLYDVKRYYKRLKQGEMFDYWLERVHSHQRMVLCAGLFCRNFQFSTKLNGKLAYSTC